MKILQVAAELFHVDGQAGSHDEANSRFSQCANAPEKERLALRSCLSARGAVSATKSFFFILMEVGIGIRYKKSSSQRGFWLIDSHTTLTGVSEFPSHFPFPFGVALTNHPRPAPRLKKE